MKIWGKYRGKVELLDECPKSEASYTVREYRMAFGPEWTIWAGLKRDDPTAADPETSERQNAQRAMRRTWG